MAQNDTKKWWFVLDENHADYAAITANLIVLAALWGETYTNVAGRNAGERVVYSYMTAAQKAASSPSLDRSPTGCVIYSTNYAKCVNPKYGARALHTDATAGDKCIVYGEFLENPQTLPTDGVDRLVEWLKGNGTDNFIFIGQDAVAGGAGTTYRTRKAVKDVLSYNRLDNATHSLTPYTGIVICGRLSRFRNEGHNINSGVAIEPLPGSSGQRTVILADCIDGGDLMCGRKLGAGNSAPFEEDADWTVDTGGAWLINHGTLAVWTSGTGAQTFVLSDAGGTLRPLTLVASIAACRSTSDSYYTSEFVTYCHLADGSNPKTTTYWGCGAITNGIQLYMLNTDYFDCYGLKFYQAKFSGTSNAFAENYRFIACYFSYGGAGKTFQADGQYTNPHTGQWVNSNQQNEHLTPDAPANRSWLGCVWEYQGDGLYDTHLTCVVPENTIVRDNYFWKTGAIAYGVNIGNSDSHSVATLGGWITSVKRNNRFHQCGWLTNVVYVPDTGHFNRNTVLTDGAITNGTFAADTNWTKTGGATISGGKAHFPGTIEQAVTIGAGYLSATRRHVCKGTLTPAGSAITVKVGKSSGASDETIGQPDATLATGAEVITSNPQTGVFAFSFVPTVSPTYIQFTSASAIDLDNVSLLIDLSAEEGYVLGYPAAKEFFSGAAYYTFAPCTDFDWSYPFITSPISSTDNPEISGEGQYFSLNGEATYGYAGQLANIDIGYGGRVEGVGGTSVPEEGFRVKWMLPSPYDTTQLKLRYCVFRNIERVLHAEHTVPDENSLTAYSTFELKNCDMQASHYTYHVRSDLNPARYTNIFDNNIIRTTYSPTYHTTGGDNFTLAQWRSSAPSGDTRDTNSVESASVPVSNGTASIAITGTAGVGNTLTATVTGTALNQSLMWLRAGEEIPGANGTTYVQTQKDYAAGSVTVSLAYQTDAALTNLATGWNLTESASFDTTGSSPAPTPGSGGIPISEGEYYRRKKKAFLTRMWDWIKRQFQ
jgi:hypothetical protein